MINISYILFFIIDLPVNYNELHEDAASVMRQLLLHTWNSWILVKAKGLTLKFFSMMIISTNEFFLKSIQVKPLTITKNSWISGV